MRPSRFYDLGLIDYSEAFDLQKRTVQEVLEGHPPTVLLCEHPPVLTLGRLATEANILVSRKYLSAEKIKVLPIDRGGEVTLHAPGQLVIYPIFDLKQFQPDLKWFLKQLEQVAIDLLQDFAIVAKGIPSQRGVWVGEEKIVSIGIGVRKWVSYHGMAINISTNLEYFSLIKPCGLNVTMTSIEAIKGTVVDLKEIKTRIRQHFCDRFELKNLSKENIDENRCFT